MATCSYEFTCLIIYHPKDSSEACRLQEIVTAAGYDCQLFFKCSGSNTITEIFRLTDSTSCVVSLITARLLDDMQQFMYHQKVYDRRCGERFIPVIRNISDKQLKTDVNLAFLVGCRIPRASSWSDAKFTEDLVDLIKATLGDRKVTSSRANHIQSCATPPPADVDDLTVWPSTQRGQSVQSPCSTPTASCSQTCETSSVQEENKGRLLGKGSSSEVYLFDDYPLPDGRVIQVARKILYMHDKSIKYFNREKALTRLRSPFLLPILEVIDKPGDRYQLTLPYMKNGSLEEMLNRKDSTWTPTADVRSRLLVIIHQVCQAVAMLHRSGFVHGDINPNNILLDEFWNSRLADYGLSVNLNNPNMEEKESDQQFQVRLGYGDPYTETSGVKSFYADIFSLGITFLQMLKYRPALIEKTQNDDCRWQLMSLYECLRHDYKGKLPTAVDLLSDQRYVEKSIWPNDNISLGFAAATLKFLSPHGPSRIEALDNLIAFAKAVQHPGLAVIDFPRDQCVYCYVGKPNRDIQLKAPSCTPDCIFLNMCHSCWTCAFSYGPVVCPNHNDYIYAPVGGQLAYALIISGRDEADLGIQKNMCADTKAIERAVEHPRILCVPRANIFRISPGENDTQECIREIMRKIVTRKPDFFLLYYSGHNDESSTKLDVSDAQGSSLDVEEIRRELMAPLYNCPRVLVILDCCFAASLDLLPTPAADSSDSHIRWHVCLPSCGRLEESNIEAHDACSLFSKYVVAGLTGARRCPNENSDCAACRDFRQTCHRNKFITVDVLNKYIDEHMKSRHRDDREDVQNPIQLTIRREEPVIAYFTDEPLYRFNVELQNGASSDPCCLDSLDGSIDEILLQLWNALNVEGRLPSSLDHKALQICQKTGKKSVLLNDVGEIIDVVHDDKNALYVKIRMDGSELDVNKWVACMCDKGGAESLIEQMSPVGTIHNVRKTLRIGGSEATVWQVRELDL